MFPSLPVAPFSSHHIEPPRRTNRTPWRSLLSGRSHVDTPGPVGPVEPRLCSPLATRVPSALAAHAAWYPDAPAQTCDVVRQVAQLAQHPHLHSAPAAAKPGEAECWPLGAARLSHWQKALAGLGPLLWALPVHRSSAFGTDVPEKRQLSQGALAQAWAPFQQPFGWLRWPPALPSCSGFVHQQLQSSTPRASLSRWHPQSLPPLAWSNRSRQHTSLPLQDPFAGMAPSSRHGLHEVSCAGCHHASSHLLASPFLEHQQSLAEAALVGWAPAPFPLPVSQSQGHGAETPCEVGWALPSDSQVPHLSTHWALAYQAYQASQAYQFSWVLFPASPAAAPLWICPLPERKYHSPWEDLPWEDFLQEDLLQEDSPQRPVEAEKASLPDCLGQAHCRRKTPRPADASAS